ncbi:MAG: hypothetical protein HN689_08210 [Euryarchaeota archaeon]|nr:hypothetical protein [Euryarchaeota archaeon]
MYYYVDILIMITAHLMALRASIRTLLLIGGLAAVGAGLLTLGVGMDTPWAPWERQSDTRFPPVLFTLASFVATVAFCASTVVFHTSLKMVTNNPDMWWRVSGVLFLLTYGTFSFISQTFEAAIMLNILHLIVGIPALTLLPRNFVTSGIFPNQKGL